MPKKRKNKKQRAIVGVLGKEITRRSRGCCELCEGREQPRLFELEPFPQDPDPDRTLMTCERCRRWLEHSLDDAQEAQFLMSAVWSELSAVRLAAGRMLLRADLRDEAWWHDAVEAADVDPETFELRAEEVEWGVA